MSVVLQSSSGWVLDSQALIDRGYTSCITWTTGHQKSRVKCNFKKQCFHISKSHYNMSGGGDGGLTVMNQKTEKSAKKRKRKHGELNQGEIDAKAFHEKEPGDDPCYIITSNKGQFTNLQSTRQSL